MGDKDSKNDFPKEGIKFSYIVKDFVPNHKLDGLTTKEVIETIIKPTTLPYRSSYCNMLLQKNKKGSSDSVGDAPSLFVSHAHSYKFLDVVDALKHQLWGKLDTIIWFDLFSINQHINTDWSFDWLANTFKSAIGQFGRVVMIMSPWNNPLPFTRAWCVFEAYCAVVTQAQFEIALSENDQQQFLMDLQNTGITTSINKMLTTIRSEDCQCYTETDKQQIFAVIRKETSFAELDSMLFGCYRSWVIMVAQQHLVKTKMSFGSDNVACLPAMTVLGRLYADQGEHSKALPLFQYCLDRSRFKLGADHVDTLVALDNLGMLYFQQGGHEKSMPLLLECVEKRKTILGADHPDTLRAMSNLATLHMKLQDHDKALALFLKCVEEMKMKLGDGDHDTLNAMNNLATVHLFRKEYDKALPIFLECFEKRKLNLGVDHPDTLASMNNLASLHNQQGEYDKAFPLLLDCLEHNKIKLGDDHPNTLKAMSSLARNHGHRDERDKALKLYVECFERSKQKFGDDNPLTLQLMDELARQYTLGGEFDKASPLFVECLERRRLILGDDHPDTIESANMLTLHFEMERRSKIQNFDMLRSKGDEPTLLSKDGTKTVDELLSDIGDDGVLGVYFAAYWCSDCQWITPGLVKCYDSVRSTGNKLEVVYVSSDRSKAEFEEHYASMTTETGQQWLAIDYNRHDLKRNLAEFFGVPGLPMMVFLRKDGMTLAEDGVRLALTMGPEHYPWDKETIERAQEAYKQREKKESEEEQSKAGGVVLRRIVGYPGSVHHKIADRLLSFLEGFSTVATPEWVTTAGVLYYEIEIVVTDWPMFQMGFMLAGEGADVVNEHTGNGVGDDSKSWAVDGYRQKLWHNGSAGRFRCSWDIGDVIGLAANVDAGKIAVSKNGSYSKADGCGVVFTSRSISSAGVFPAVSAFHANTIRYAMDHKQFKHGPPSADVWSSTWCPCWDV